MALQKLNPFRSTCPFEDRLYTAALLQSSRKEMFNETDDLFEILRCRYVRPGNRRGAGGRNRRLEKIQCRCRRVERLVQPNREKQKENANFRRYVPNHASRPLPLGIQQALQTNDSRRRPAYLAVRCRFETGNQIRPVAGHRRQPRIHPVGQKRFGFQLQPEGRRLRRRH